MVAKHVGLFYAQCIHYRNNRLAIIIDTKLIVGRIRYAATWKIQRDCGVRVNKVRPRAEKLVRRLRRLV